MDFRLERVGELAAAVRAGKVGARELVQGALDRIDELDDQVNAFVALDPEAALGAARAVDERAARSEEVGRLAGIPLAVKDLEDVAGLPTTRGSAAFASTAPAASDSELVARLKAEGCVVVGKTNTPELGFKDDTNNRIFGATHNPWNLEHSPGGSSGGSAAAIAAGMVPLATGSDGGGSIRVPSAVCGLSGFKPALGRVPTGGLEPPDWHHLSTRGVMARTMREVVLALDAVVGSDPTDLRSIPAPESPWLDAIESARVPLRVAWSPTLGYAPLDDEVLAICVRAVRVLESLGVEVVEVDSVFPEDPIMPWVTLVSAYNLRTLERFHGTEKWELLDPLVAGMAEWAATLPAIEVVRAEDACHRLNLKLVELFADVGLLVTPTCATPAPRSGEPGVLNATPEVNWVRFTYPFNLTRSPAATVCAGFSRSGLPVGIQLVGPQRCDSAVIGAAAALEMALGLDPIAPLPK